VDEALVVRSVPVAERRGAGCGNATCGSGRVKEWGIRQQTVYNLDSNALASSTYGDVTCDGRKAFLDDGGQCVDLLLERVLTSFCGWP
jgi:hypothetical protein